MFQGGMIQLIDKSSGEGRRTVLVYSPTEEVITSHDKLEEKLVDLGWERYSPNDPELIQFHKASIPNFIISTPRDFSRIRSIHMYDIAYKTRNMFSVRDA